MCYNSGFGWVWFGWYYSIASYLHLFAECGHQRVVVLGLAQQQLDLLLKPLVVSLQHLVSRLQFTRVFSHVFHSQLVAVMW